MTKFSIKSIIFKIFIVMMCLLGFGVSIVNPVGIKTVPAEMCKIQIADAKSFPSFKEIIKNLVEQVTGTVRWRETILFLQEQGITDIVELGAGKVLSGIAKRSVKEINSISVGSVAEIEELAKNL